MGAKWFGAAVKRKEDPALLRGEGRYIDDIHLHAMLHAAFVRSPHPHARITGVDKTRALALPGVHLILAFDDLPATLRAQRLPLFVPHPDIKQPILPYSLAKDEVCYAGEPVAAVIADSRQLAM